MWGNVGISNKYLNNFAVDELINSVGSSLRRIFSFLTVSSLFIGATGFFQTFCGFLLFEMKPNIPLCFAVFLMTFSVYSLNKLTDLSEDAINMPERVAYISKRKKFVLYYSIGAYLLCLIIAVLQSPRSLPFVLVPIVSNAVYSSKLIPGLPRLKDIPIMKNVTVAVSWAVVCTLIPGMYMEPFSKSLVITFVYFMIVRDFISTALYDIRDAEGDKRSGVRTMPVIFGTEKTAKILLVMNSTLLPLLPFVWGGAKLLIAGFIVYGYGCILYFKSIRDPLILDFFVDGEWLLASISILSLKWMHLLF